MGNERGGVYFGTSRRSRYHPNTRGCEARVSLSRERETNDPSFLRLLAVATGLVSNKTSGLGEKSNVWDGLSHNNPGERAVSQFRGIAMEKPWDSYKSGEKAAQWNERNKKVWRHEQEEHFSRWSSTERAHLETEYHCAPQMDPQFVSALIKDNSKIKGRRFEYLMPHPYELYVCFHESKHRWKRDSESKTCEASGCTSPMKTGYRHHCRFCGGLFCSKHSSAKKKLFNVDTQRTESVRVCHECVAHLPPTLRPEHDAFALRKGDSVIRPAALARTLAQRASRTSTAPAGRS